jgi:hypothetical protein
MEKLRTLRRITEKVAPQWDMVQRYRSKYIPQKRSSYLRMEIPDKTLPVVTITAVISSDNTPRDADLLPDTFLKLLRNQFLQELLQLS